jgi:hypothetical protein
MFIGRPINAWNGLIAGAIGLAITIIGVTQPAAIAQQWAIILGAIGGFLGLLIAFLAGQPPTLNPGDTFKTVTPAGQPNAVTTVAVPPAPSETMMLPADDNDGA